MPNDNKNPDSETETQLNGTMKSQVPTKLKQELERTCLPEDIKEQILDGLPSLEEQEKLFRELQEKGGLSSEQFLNSLDLQVEQQP